MATDSTLVIKKRSKFQKAVTSLTFWRGVAALLGFLIIWEICSRMELWTAEYQAVEYTLVSSSGEQNSIVKVGDSISAKIGDYGAEYVITKELLEARDNNTSPMTIRNMAEEFTKQINKDFKIITAEILYKDGSMSMVLTGAKPSKYTSEMSINGTQLQGVVLSEAFSIAVPWIGKVPPPTEVIVAWKEIIVVPGYWESWYLSTGRVFAGFIMAQIIGIPFGLLLAVNRYFRDIFFPPFEILRPIPPLAWVPASIVFWPTTEMSIAFVTFLGAFFTIVINVLGGAKSIDVRYLRSAQSMGASQWDLFSKIILPGTLPSIFTGAAVGMGITWEVVLAGEMISGGGGQQASGGLGFFIWSSYMGGTVAQVIVGMISIGIAGYLSSSLIRFIGDRSMPWKRLF